MTKRKKDRPEAVIAELRRLLRETEEARRLAIQDFGVMRGRATRAETEREDWKRRFDALLARVPLAGLSTPEPGEPDVVPPPTCSNCSRPISVHSPTCAGRPWHQEWCTPTPDGACTCGSAVLR